MLITTLGVVLKSRNIGEQDKIITILSKDLGVIEASARNIRRIKSGLVSSSQVLGYSEFTLFCNKEKYTINSAHSIKSFYDIRLDVQQLSLASYFCELITFLSIHSDTSNEMLRLILNTLSFIEDKTRDDKIIKSIFEFRALSISGFMPNLVGCKSCNEYDGKMYFDICEGTLTCEKCFDGKTSNCVELTDSVLAAMRHIIYSPLDKLFNFTLSDKSIISLGYITENYVLGHIERTFKSLDLYKSFLGGTYGAIT
jgi:DNA repair protein RecO (recombination protein O)